MINVDLIRQNPKVVKDAINKKGGDVSVVDEFLATDKNWRELKVKTDKLRSEQKAFGLNQREKGAKAKKEIQINEKKISAINLKRDALLEQIPNLPAADVPLGKDDSENVVLREVGKKPAFKFKPKDYFSLAGKLIDTEKAGQVAGSRFSYIFGDLVLLEFALIKLATDTLLPYGFMPVAPPVMVKPSVMKGMGKSKFLTGGDAFYINQDDLYLAGSSEHTIGPFHLNDVFGENDLPRRYVGFSACFRREAGSYGKDTKGILRVHQFDKIEMFSFVKPEKSEDEHQFLLARQEELLQKLKLAYQVVYICAGDMGFGDYKQFDLETWLPGQGKYRETHSCSNTTDFQARGINAKYRVKSSQKIEFVHMLNATAFAIGRTIIAILENYQTADGRVRVPDVLRDYLGKEFIGDSI